MHEWIWDADSSRENVNGKPKLHGTRNQVLWKRDVTLLQVACWVQIELAGKQTGHESGWYDVDAVAASKVFSYVQTGIRVDERMLK
jgi:hypothetical protein